MTSRRQGIIGQSGRSASRVVKTPRPYPNGNRRSVNGVLNETNTTKWPDFAQLITFVAVACFTASLTYVAGLSLGMNQNLVGFFDLSDFLRITSSWAIPALGVSTFLSLRSYVANAHRVEEKKLSTSEPKTKEKSFSSGYGIPTREELLGRCCYNSCNWNVYFKSICSAQMGVADKLTANECIPLLSFCRATAQGSRTRSVASHILTLSMVNSDLCDHSQ